MKKIFFGLFLQVVITTIVTAQVTMQPTLPFVGMVQKSQLWNLTVINGTAEQYDCRLELILRDRATGQEVLTASSGQFNIGTGAKQLNINTLSPVQYNYLGASNASQSLVPAGSYMLCYLLYAVGKETPLAEECAPFDTEPLSPPMLIFPADSAELDIAPNQFSWIPPTPAGMFDMLRYEVMISTVEPGQKAEQAIQENIPFYLDANQFNNMISYPASANRFENDTWYAWQVIAKDDKSYAGRSEVWVFKIKSTSLVKKIIEQTPYIKMKKTNPEKGMAPNGILKLSYINETEDSIAVVQIIDQNSPGKIAGRFTVSLKPGENLVAQDLKKIINYQEHKIYEAQIINARKEKWVMQFEVHTYQEKK